MNRSRPATLRTRSPKHLAVALAALFVLGFSIYIPDLFYDRAQTSNGIILPEEIVGLLMEQLEAVDPASAEAAEIREQIRKVRSKAQGYAPAENPGAFLEALAEVRTDLDGTTYQRGYREVELARAVAAREKRGISGAAGEILPWVEQGPGNIAGRARGIAVDPQDPSGNTWFVATIGGGVWKTTDAGLSWQNKSPDMTTYTTTTIAIAESNPQVIYVGTGMGYGRVVDISGSGVWKSTDGGESWNQLPSTANGELFGAINRLIVDPEDEDVVVLCSNSSFAHLSADEGDSTRPSGIFRTTDGGTSWTQVFAPDEVLPSNRDNRVQQVIATPGNFDVQYAAVNEVGVVKSTDAGVTWEISADNFALPSDIGNPNGGWQGLSGISVRTELAVASTDPNRVYAAVERPRGVADLYMSVDAGGSWELMEDNGSDPNWFNGFGVSGAQQGAYTAGWFDNTIAVSPYDESEVIVGGVNIYKIRVNPGSRTRTTTPIAWWIANPQGIPFAHADHHFLVTLPNPDGTSYRILDANDGGVAISSDSGATWQQRGGGMGTTQFYGADKMPGRDRYIGGMQDNGTWFTPSGSGAGGAWTNAFGGDGFEALWNYGDPALMLGSQQFGSVFRSTDTGATWTQIPAARVSGGQFITKLAGSQADPDMVYTIGPGGMGRSDDFGLTWRQLALPQNWIGYRPFSNVEASVADPYVVWLSSKLTLDRVTNSTGGVHVSRDGALSFTDVTANLPSGLTEPSGIGTHPTDPATAYLLFATPGKAKILRTTDFGASWEDLSGFAAGGASNNGFPDVGVFSLLVMPYDTDVIWAGTEIGLFESTDGGQSWVYAENGFPRVTAFQMKVVDDQVVAATYGRGVWSVALPELSDYRPPVVPLIPQIDKLALRPDGMILIDVDRRSPYDSTTLMIDGQTEERFGANSAREQDEIVIEATSEKRINVQLVSWVDGRPLPTAPQTLDIFPTTPIFTWSASFEDPSEGERIFRSPSFGVVQEIGFSSRALHTAHPYPNGSQIVALLKDPVIVSENRASAILRFDEVVLVEEGVGTWPNANFFDYCIVEGSTDGCVWVPLLDGYDSRDHGPWSTTFNQGLDGTGNSKSVGTEDLYWRREIDLQETFAGGDTIFIRWRLESDPAANAWGWAIDNIEVQPLPGSVLPTPPGPGTITDHNLTLTGPNPFSTGTRFRVDEGYHGEIEIYDVTGRRVASLEVAGQTDVEWDGRDMRGNEVPSGSYFARVEDGRSRVIRIVRE